MRLTDQELHQLKKRCIDAMSTNATIANYQSFMLSLIEEVESTRKSKPVPAPVPAPAPVVAKVEAPPPPSPVATAHEEEAVIQEALAVEESLSKKAAKKKS